MHLIFIKIYKFLSFPSLLRDLIFIMNGSWILSNTLFCAIWDYKITLALNLLMTRKRCSWGWRVGPELRLQITAQGAVFTTLWPNGFLLPPQPFPAFKMIFKEVFKWKCYGDIFLLSEIWVTLLWKNKIMEKMYFDLK